MTLVQALNDIAQLNSSNTTEWQYVAHLFSSAGGSSLHVVVIPLADGAYSMETTVTNGHTARQQITKNRLQQMPCAKRSSWDIWKWLPNEERRIFRPAEETTISEGC